MSLAVHRPDRATVERGIALLLAERNDGTGALQCPTCGEAGLVADVDPPCVRCRSGCSEEGIAHRIEACAARFNASAADLALAVRLWVAGVFVRLARRRQAVSVPPAPALPSLHSATRDQLYLAAVQLEPSEARDRILSLVVGAERRACSMSTARTTHGTGTTENAQPRAREAA